MIFNDEVAGRGHRGLKKQQSHRELNAAHDEQDGFRHSLAGQAEPYESLFARTVQVQPHPTWKRVESFPGHEFCI
jgi:hypothetical protein